MRAVAESVGGMMSCASCGIKKSNGVELKICTACHLALYCGRECQKNHWPKHKKECKQRAAELRDQILFREPEGSCFGDCPICFLPHPIDERKSTFATCCSKLICNGCDYANQKREAEEKRERKCAFCRRLLPKSEEEQVKLVKDRAGKNDPTAMQHMGFLCHEKGDYRGAFEYFSKSAELGNVVAHYQLGIMYHLGVGVEKDKLKNVYHNEQAAIGGHPSARFNLGCIEYSKGHRERAIKHWVIAAKLGDDESLEMVKDYFQDGLASKDDFEAALRGHQAAVDATKSPDREVSEAKRGSGEIIALAT